MTQRACETCRWWNRHTGLPTGDCQRLTPNSSTSKWPCTDEADFCGEWADGTITPKEAERRELVRQFALAIVASDAAGDSMVHRVWQRAEELADYKGQQ